VVLITGYLGSGKTTLLNRILNNAEGIRFAVIVNDIGEVNIDASLIQKGGIVGQNGSEDLVALQNGCICCTLKADLMAQISELLAKDCFDYIAIEASGVCEPAPIANTICTMQSMPTTENVTALPRLDCIVTVTDALRLKTEFGCGSNLLEKNLDEEDIENLIIDQIEFCNLILLNKVDEISRQEADEIKVIIKTLQPVAPVIETNYADVPLKDILYTNLFDFERTATSATWIREVENPETNVEGHSHEHDVHHNHSHEHDNEHEHGDSHHHEENHHGHEHNHEHHHHHHDHDHGETEEYGIGTWVYFRRRPFDLDKFDRFVAKDWPVEIIRSKGLIYFSQSPNMSYLFEQVGVQKNLKESGLWYASAPAEELEIMLARDEALRRDWDEEYGDRMIKLVFIGRNIDKQRLQSLLNKC
ncbi:MAG: GTP-binding protein, partial [Muribaculaceae bacterium]|nr:GTP-binding protein [Muribaculaceae bacterium]